MKAGWQTKSLGDLCHVIGGGTPPKDKSEYYTGDIPWATVRDMRSDVITDTECKITKEAVKASSTNIIPGGNVVIATRVGLGKVCLIGQDTAINQDLRGIIPINPKNLSVQFLYWWLKYSADLIVAEGTGATVQGVKLPFVKSLQIPHIPLPEQQRIVTIIDEAFDDIATANANAEKNLQNARALFESHLQSVFTQRGEGWVEKSIGQCFKVRSGDFLPAKTMIKTGEIDVYGGNGIAGKHNAKNLSGENIVIGRVGAKCGNVRHLVGDLWLTDNAFYISEYYCEFDLAFLERLLTLKQLRNTANQAAQPVISYTTIKDVLLEFPASKAAQKTIAGILDALETETQRLETIYKKKLAALDALKKSLLDQAFTGQL